MRSFDELLNESSAIHGHHCAGQILGVRMAMLGCREVGIDEPRGCKKLVVYAEIDRCATDAVQAVTGCSLGKRTLKFLDYGKMAVTFVNTETSKAVRVLARDEARKFVPDYARDAPNPREAQKQAYRIMPEEALFSVKSVNLEIPGQEMPGYRSMRVECALCGEGINFHREVRVEGRTLCIPCARLSSNGSPIGASTKSPKVLLIVGYKKVGKTTLIEKLIPELSERGYRVATVKHHHSDFPASLDAFGTDTWRHRQAGAAGVVLVTPTEIAVFRDGNGRNSLDEIIALLGSNDIVLVEGFHDQPHAKIEVLSDHSAEPLCKADGSLVAIVTANGHRSALPTFAPTSIAPIADLIEREVLNDRRHG